MYLFRGLVFQWSHHYLELVPSQTSQSERPSHGGELLVGGWCKCAVGGMSGRGTPLAGNGPAWAFVSPGVWDCEQSRDTNAETMSESVGLSGTLWDSSWGTQTQRQWGCKQNLESSSPYLKLSLIGKETNTLQIRYSLNEAVNEYYGKTAQVLALRPFYISIKNNILYMQHLDYISKCLENPAHRTVTSVWDSENFFAQNVAAGAE